jgi:Ni,Fe-hydrogenase maturation factor
MVSGEAPADRGGPSAGTVAGSRRILVAGIGSPHGDDRAGWDVADRMASHVAVGGGGRMGSPRLDAVAAARVVRLSVPHDLFDHLESVDVLHLIDAGVGVGVETPFARYDVAFSSDPARRVLLRSCRDGETMRSGVSLRSGATHQIDLFSVLRLADSLGQLPRVVALWVIPGQRAEPGTDPSDACRQRIDRCAASIAAELRGGTSADA